MEFPSAQDFETGITVRHNFPVVVLPLETEWLC